MTKSDKVSEKKSGCGGLAQCRFSCWTEEKKEITKPKFSVFFLYFKLWTVQVKEENESKEMSLSFNFLFDDTHQPDSNNIVQL
jgi:hypothetical protein